MDHKLFEILALLGVGILAGAGISFFIVLVRSKRSLASLRADFLDGLAATKTKLEQQAAIEAASANETHKQINRLREAFDSQLREINGHNSSLQNELRESVAQAGELKARCAMLADEQGELTEKLRRSESELQSARDQLCQLALPLSACFSRNNCHHDVLAIGTDCNHPAIRIAALNDADIYERAMPLDSGLGLGRINSAFAAVLPLLAANAQQGRQLMEVVIQGDLVRASAGGGFRAWSVGTNGGISEHARLFDADRLNTLVNASAIWSLASVIVAQKHLADISEKLKDISYKIDQVKDFLRDQRYSLIKSTYDYLQQTASAIQSGDLPEVAIRSQLEGCERDLMSIQDHLIMEFRSLAAQPVEHTDLVGTRDLYDNLISRFKSIVDIGSQLDLCLRTRVLNWFVLSLFPGEEFLKNVRKEAIADSAKRIANLRDDIDSRQEEGLSRFQSIFNKKETIDCRKADIAKAAETAKQELWKISLSNRISLEGLAQRLNYSDEPIRLVLELEGNQVVKARHLASA